MPRSGCASSPAIAATANQSLNEDELTRYAVEFLSRHPMLFPLQQRP